VGARRAPRLDLGTAPAGQLSRDAQEAEVAIHRPLLLVDARAQQLAGALLGTALTAGVAEFVPRQATAAA
jgi:hypothetical protein